MTASLSAPHTTIGFGNVLRSEWTKLRSVRSTYWTALVAALGTIGRCGARLHPVAQRSDQRQG